MDQRTPVADLQPDEPTLARLAGHFTRHRRWFVLTGAGVSTASGIPDYRDRDGEWKRSPPMTAQRFLAEPQGRARYWARSLLGWPRIDAARPNAAHRALARLDRLDRVTTLVTQNVDGLHQRAGSSSVIDLHGRLESVVCLGCGARVPRAALQRQLAELNAGWLRGLQAALGVRLDGVLPGGPGHPDAASPTAPDGDVDLDHVTADYASFRVPDCASCGGTLKPDVVFFGENVPRQRVADALSALGSSDAMLVAGSSLMVFSGFRFAREAAARRIPVVAINLGRTRADDLLADKFEMPCDAALPALLQRIAVA
ncbi:MAG TPA: NAD-dependent protein deacetylase [Burkholderiaceae bacterium]|nr:NAD-dependent protein deacetylase [Burkholderiaceae bacterium]